MLSHEVIVMKPLEELLSIAAEKHGSDLHIITGRSPGIRINGTIEVLEGTPMSPEETTLLSRNVLNDIQLARLEEKGDADTAYACKNIFDHSRMLRARVNVFKDFQGISFVFRLIPERIPTMCELMLPLSLRNLIDAEHGFIIITGPTGSGKTTTLASMLDAINAKRSGNIITLEDPIEYVYPQRKSFISQREIG